MTQALVFVDKSITSLTGSSQTLTGYNVARRILIIQNTGTANVGINLAGGTAAVAGTGTLTLAANSAPMILDEEPPQNAVTVIGTSGQPVACIEA